MQIRATKVIGPDGLEIRGITPLAVGTLILSIILVVMVVVAMKYKHKTEEELIKDYHQCVIRQVNQCNKQPGVVCNDIVLWQQFGLACIYVGR